jgi:hypothetical protein
LNAYIIDFGAGESNFVDVLLHKGYNNIGVLNISALAIEKVKTRLGDKAKLLYFLVSNNVNFHPNIIFDFWHYIAAFHFLTTNESINQYVAIAFNAIAQNGYLVLGTFSENGCEKCSGLQIQ